MGTVANEMERRLRDELRPLSLRVIDQSAQHAGHSGVRPEGETHFLVEVVSAEFDGLSRVARQRRVHAVLRDLLSERVHALSLRTRTPVEAGVGTSL